MTTAAAPVEETPKESPVYRVFVGNLSYKVNDDKLKAFFEPCGTIVDAHVVKRYGRSAGYGFVTFEDEASLDKALAMKGTELEERQINVENATPRGENAGQSRGKGRRSRGQGRGKGRGRGGKIENLEEAAERSKLTLFVGNLPYNVVDTHLVDIFSDFELEKAHIVRRFDGASRGFGFVTLKSEEAQAQALEKLAEVYCDDRRLIIRAALVDEPHKPQAHDVKIETH